VTTYADAQPRESGIETPLVGNDISRAVARKTPSNAALRDGQTTERRVGDLNGSANGSLTTSDERTFADRDRTERRTPVSRQGCRVVACVDVRPVTVANAGAIDAGAVWSVALRPLERCCRPVDSICMVGPSRLVVCLGHGSHDVPPLALGRRLAHAMGGHLSVGAANMDLEVRVGVAATNGDIELPVLSTAAQASVNVNSSSDENSNGLRNFVAITRVPGAHRARPQFSTRIIFPVTEESNWSPRHSENGHVRSLGDGKKAKALGSTARRIRFLLVDPGVGSEAKASPTLEVVAEIARRLGARPIMCTASSPEAVQVNAELTDPDIAVLVLQSDGPEGQGVGDTIEACERAAALARALREVKLPVIALKMGASVVSLAACVEQGAAGVLHPDLLPEAVSKAIARGRGNDALDGPGYLPAPYQSLMLLTPCERRVLFHMMEGRAAAGIASSLVVSVTTVRSHIRSILRKLNVNSQLAAVGIAFGHTFDQAAEG